LSNDENLLNFYTAQQNGLVSLGIELNSGGVTIADQSSANGFFNKDTWTMVAIVVEYHTETRVSDVDMYANLD